MSERIHQLLREMTLPEKVAQMNVVARAAALDFSIDQDPVERLGLPALRAVDGPRGVHLLAEHRATCYPAALALAASWDTSLADEVLDAITTELLGHGLHQLYAPGLNLIIDPRCGRNAEYFSEDPCLSAEMAVAACRAIERRGGVSTPKHFCCNNFESGRFVVDVRVPERPLRELFLRAFERLVREVRPRSIMTCYNSVNGHFLAANPELQGLLRDWGFDGFVVSDWGANMEDCARALKAGTDMEMPGHRWFNVENLQSALDAGKIDMADIDRAVAAVLGVKERIGLLDGKAPEATPDREDRRPLLRRAGAEAIVLLKNEGDLLPLDADAISSIALFGPMADTEDILANQGSSTVPPTACVTLREALETQPGIDLTHDTGCEFFAYPGAAMRNDLVFEASYWNNSDLEGEPVLQRRETGLRHRPFVTEEAPLLCEGVQGRAWEFSGAIAAPLPAMPREQDLPHFTISFWYFLVDQFPPDTAPLLALDVGKDACLHLHAGALFALDKQIDFRRHLRFNGPSQRWVHAVLVRGPEGLRLLLDGEQVAECRRPPENWLLRPSLHLAGSPNAAQAMPCRIDELRVFDRALEPDEITALNALDEVPRPLYRQSCEEPLPPDAAQVLPGVERSTAFSARWTTRFVPERSGKHAFRVTGQDAVRIHLDGQTLVDAWFEQHLDGIHHYLWPVLEAGHACELEIEYAASRANGYIDMTWCGPPEQDLFESVREQARAADVALVAAGIQACHFQGEAVDRSAFALTGWQDELIEAVAGANPRTVVLLTVAGGVDMRRWIERTPALLVNWPQGQEAGNAIRDVLFGEVEPGGRLPVTFPLALEQLDTPFAKAQYADSVCDFGYRRFDARDETVLFPFGHGLGYTRFQWSDFEVAECDEGLCARVTLRNTGERPGSEVVQFYAGKPAADMEQAPRELCGFRKIRLQAGEEARVECLLHWRELAVWDLADSNWRVVPGRYRIEATASSRDIKLHQSLDIRERDI